MKIYNHLARVEEREGEGGSVPYPLIPFPRKGNAPFLRNKIDEIVKMTMIVIPSWRKAKGEGVGRK